MTLQMNLVSFMRVLTQHLCSSDEYWNALQTLKGAECTFSGLKRKCGSFFNTLKSTVNDDLDIVDSTMWSLQSLTNTLGYIAECALVSIYLHLAEGGSVQVKPEICKPLLDKPIIVHVNDAGICSVSQMVPSNMDHPEKGTKSELESDHLSSSEPSTSSPSNGRDPFLNLLGASANISVHETILPLGKPAPEIVVSGKDKCLVPELNDSSEDDEFPQLTFDSELSSLMPSTDTNDKGNSNMDQVNQTIDYCLDIVTKTASYLEAIKAKVNEPVDKCCLCPRHCLNALSRDIKKPRGRKRPAADLSARNKFPKKMS